MHKKQSFLLFVILGLSLFLIWGCTEDEPTFPLRTLKGNAKTTGTIQTLATQGLTTGDPKDISVYLPPDYNPSGSYPMVIALHGIGQDHTAFLNYQLDKLLDVMITEGTIEPMIVVMPSAANDLGGGYYTNSIDLDPNRNPTLNPALGFGAYEQLIMQEVMGVIQAAGFAVDNSKMALMGVSMGGYGAVKLGMLYADMFKAVVSHSGILSFNEVFFHPQSNVRVRIPMENVDLSGNPLPIIDLNLASQDQTTHPLTLGVFGMASSFSPHFGTADTYDSFLLSQGAPINPADVYQFIVSPTPVDTAGPGPLDDIYAGVDLPVKITQPGQMSDTVGTVWNKFMAHDCYTMLATGKNYLGADIDLDAFKNIHLYLDCGTEDDFDLADDGFGLGLFFTNEAFAELLTEKDIDHMYVPYTGSHGSDYYYRFEVGLKEISMALQ